MSTFVPGGQAGEESLRLSREAEVQAVQRDELRAAEPPRRPSLVKRILGTFRRAQ